MNIVRPLDRQHARRVELASSQVRPARCRFFVDAEGLGASQMIGDAALAFDTYFTEEPTCSFGVMLSRSPGLQEGDEIEFLPMAISYVTRYLTNDLGLYTGAEVYLRTWHPQEVYDASSIVEEEYAFRFSLTFEGFALRTTSKIV